MAINLGLFLTLCVAFVGASAIQLELKRIESFRSRLLRTGNWDDYRASSGQPLTDFDDGEYILNVSIGTPPQAFLVLVDMGRRSEFFVPDKSCAREDCPSYCRDSVYCKSLCDPRCCGGKKAPKGRTASKGCGWRNRFDSDRSSSYRKNGTQFTSVSNGSGFIGIDSVTLGGSGSGGLTILSQPFGQATDLPFLTPADAYDGYLQFGTLAIPSIWISPLESAKQQGLIAANLVTFALTRDGANSPDLPGGTITFGEVDTKNCGPVAYLAVAGDPNYIPIEAVSFGKFFAVDTDWTAHVTLTSNTLSGPTEFIDRMADVAGAKKTTFNGFAVYEIECNATVPSLFLTLGGQRFEIPPAELVRPLGVTSTGCMLNVEDKGQTDSIHVGAALGRKYCLIADYDNARFGLAPIRGA